MKLNLNFGVCDRCREKIHGRYHMLEEDVVFFQKDWKLCSNCYKDFTTFINGGAKSYGESKEK